MFLQTEPFESGLMGWNRNYFDLGKNATHTELFMAHIIRHTNTDTNSHTHTHIHAQKYCNLSIYMTNINNRIDQCNVKA